MSRRSHGNDVVARAIRRKLEDMRAVKLEREEGELDDPHAVKLDFRALPDRELEEVEESALELAHRAYAEKMRRENERRTFRWKNLVAHFSSLDDDARVARIEGLAALWLRDAPHHKFWSPDKRLLTLLSKNGEASRYLGVLDNDGLLITEGQQRCNLTIKGPTDWP